MNTLLLISLLTANTPSSSAAPLERSAARARYGDRANAAGPMRIAQQGERDQEDKEKEKRRRRPPIPSLKSLKQINRPAEKPELTRPSGRVQPTKPVLRPGGAPAQAVERAQPRAQDARARRSSRPTPTGPRPASRAIRSSTPERVGAPDAGARDEDERTENAGGSDATDIDKKCRPLPRRVKVRMNFNEAEVMEIVQWISEQTCKNFIIGDGIRGGKITILSNTPVTASEAYRAFLSALNVNNMTVVRVGKFYKIQMKREAARDTIPTYVGEEVSLPHLDLMVTRLVQLKYIDANMVNGTVKQLTTKDGDSYPYAPTNSLIISDTASNLHRINAILEQLDTPLGQEEIRVISVQYALANELAQTLEEIFGQKGSARSGSQRTGHRIRPARAPQAGSRPPPGGGEEAGEEGVQVSKIIADERTNQLVVVATARSFARLQELIDKLDVPIAGEGQIQVIYLEHADAEELASTLTSLAQGTHTRPTRGGKKPASKGPAKAAELFQGEVKVTADKATNSLVIVASQSDFRSLLNVIKKLDIARRQVFVEAVIMEVNMDNTREVGLTFHGGTAADIGGETVPLIFGTQFKVQGQNMNSLSVLGNLQMLGFLSGLRGPDLEGSESILGSVALPSFGVVLQALQTDSNVNVLSTPHILTSDNEEAEIKVGENIPIPAGYGPGGLSSLAGLASLASQSGTASTQSRYGGYGRYGGLSSLGMGFGMGAINRQEVGLTLKIKPQINEGDFIRMELEEELSEVKDTSNPLGPTTTKRSAKTVVVVKDQQTVVVGGLMRDKIDVGETKIPVLGDLPVIGWLFRTKRQQKTKTNLLLFLTPYVIESQADFRTIFERKIRERREFMERFYGRGREYEAFIDFRRKHGPLADVHLQLRIEMAKLENGGRGSADEVLITPDGSGRTKVDGSAGTPEPGTRRADAAEPPAKADASRRGDQPESPEQDRLEVE